MRSVFWVTGVFMVLAGCQSPQAKSNATNIASPDIASIIDPIDRVRAAYQIDRLKKATTIRLEDDVRQNFPDHDYSPDFHEMSAQRRHYIIDLENQSASSEFLTNIANTYYHERSVHVDGKGQSIIYASGYYQDQGDVDFMAQYGGVMRSSEAMLALFLDKAGDTARLEGETMWLGKLHDKVTFDFPNSPPLTLLIQKNTGYISKMSRRVGEDFLVSYTFNFHTLQDGIPVAREHGLYGNSDRLYYSINRRVVVDDHSDKDAFEIEMDLLPEPERVDQSAMTAEALSDNLFQVGQGDFYAAFVKTNQGLVAFGVEAGFTERLQAYRSETSDTSPLVYAIAANHHNVRLAGLPDAITAGATLLVTPNARARVLESLNDDGLNSRVETIDFSKTIGALTIYNLATSVAAQNLVAYNSVDQTVLQTGHYAAPFKDTPLWGDYSGATLLQSLKPLRLNPAYLISSDSRRAENWNAFQTAIEKLPPSSCARNRQICKGHY